MSVEATRPAHQQRRKFKLTLQDYVDEMNLEAAADGDSNDNGSAFSKLASDYSLFIPQTFIEDCRGWTWASNHGAPQKSRLNRGTVALEEC